MRDFFPIDPVGVRRRFFEEAGDMDVNPHLRAEQDGVEVLGLEVIVKRLGRLSAGQRIDAVEIALLFVDVARNGACIVDELLERVSDYRLAE